MLVASDMFGLRIEQPFVWCAIVVKPYALNVAENIMDGFGHHAKTRLINNLKNGLKERT